MICTFGNFSSVIDLSWSIANDTPAWSPAMPWTDVRIRLSWKGRFSTSEMWNEGLSESWKSWVSYVLPHTFFPTLSSITLSHDVWKPFEEIVQFLQVWILTMFFLRDLSPSPILYLTNLHSSHHQWAAWKKKEKKKRRYLNQTFFCPAVLPERDLSTKPFPLNASIPVHPCVLSGGEKSNK